MSSLSSFCVFGVTLCGISVINQNVFEQQNAGGANTGLGAELFGSFVNYASLGTVNTKKPRPPHQSPCPKKFQYVSDGRRWRGLIRLKNADISQDISLRAEFLLPADIVLEKEGFIEMANYRESLPEDIYNGLPIIYRVKFPIQNPVPKLKAIYVNNQLYCGNSDETGPDTISFVLDNYLQTDPSWNTNSRSGGHSGENSGEHHHNNKKNKNKNNNNQHGNQNGNKNKPRPNQNQNQQYSNQNYQPQPQQQNYKPQPQQQNYQPLPQTQQTLQNPSNPSSINQFQSDNSVCGTPVAGFTQSLVIGGQSAGRGEWPWLTAFYRSASGNLEFICGGSLITQSYVLTAAHCIQDKGREAPQLPKEALLFIGKHNLNEWNEEGYERRGAKIFKVHPEWNPSDERYDADIALIEMDQPVKYTKYIRPICLWNGVPDIADIVGQVGIVAGWGKNDDGKLNVEFPKKVNVPIASDGQCLRTHEAFVHITSDRTFCAGGRNGEGPCQGDSGGGLVMKVGKKWFIRGIVSASLRDGNSCDVNSYAIFTDIVKFIPWIKSQM